MAALARNERITLIVSVVATMVAGTLTFLRAGPVLIFVAVTVALAVLRRSARSSSTMASRSSLRGSL